MSGQTVGYRRVSTVVQNTGRQLDGVPVDRVFEDKQSGKDTNRPALQEMLAFIRDGDTVMVHSLDRLGRNLDDLRTVVRGMVDKGITVKFLKENLTFAPAIGNPFSELMLNMLGAFAQFERELIRERQREGVQLAKAKGLYRGRKQEMTEERLAEIRQRLAAGESKVSICKALDISRDTLYRYIKD